MLPAINVRFRLRSVVFILLLTFLMGSVVYLRRKLRGSLADLEVIDIIKTRKSFSDPIYRKWAATDRLAKSIHDNCVLYFNEFQAWSKKDDYSFQDLLLYQFTPLIHKKAKWIAEEKKHYRRELRLQGISLDDSHMQVLESRFNEESRRLSQFEKSFVQNTASLRIFGKCFLDENVAFDDSSCSRISSKLLPWLLGKLPSIESWESNVVKEDEARECVVKVIEKKMKGKGIVIPLLPKQDRGKQTVLVARLIQVLRASQNTLPIEIVYVEEGEISKQRKDMLIYAARSHNLKLPNSLGDYIEAYDMKLTLELPRQDIRFVNLRPAISKSVPVTDTIAWTLSTIFNSFEEMIVLSPHTIPFIENLQTLFDGEEYNEKGTFLFKQRSLLTFKPLKFPDGFFEVNSLVNDYSGAMGDDYKYFQLSKPKPIATKWVRDQGFTKLLDPSMAVINKRKTLSGLLLAGSLPFYKFLLPKYDFTLELNAENIWLGIEMAAHNVHFNKNSAAAAGVLTPPQNTPPDSFARELCSSSWAQIHEENDFTLIYVTSHQLENRVLDDFAAAVIDRLTISPGENKGQDGGRNINLDPQKSLDNQLMLLKFKKNLLYIQSVLQPIAIEEPDIHTKNEPSTPWVQINDFGSADDYWCAYDVVGSINLPNRGFIIDYNSKITARHLFLLDVWQQTPQSDRNPSSHR